MSAACARRTVVAKARMRGARDTRSGRARYPVNHGAASRILVLVTCPGCSVRAASCLATLSTPLDVYTREHATFPRCVGST